MKRAYAMRPYAKAIVSLMNQDSEKLRQECQEFLHLVQASREVQDVFSLHIFTEEEKELVLLDILKKASFSLPFQNFLKFLVSQKRINLFEEIFQEVFLLCDQEQGLLRGTIERAQEEVRPQVLEQIKQYFESQFKRKIEFSLKKNLAITCGYKITAEDLQLDATVDHQLDLLMKT